MIEGTKIQATAGDVLLGPSEILYKHHNSEPGTLETTDIHLSDRWIQANLDDYESVDDWKTIPRHARQPENLGAASSGRS